MQSPLPTHATYTQLLLDIEKGILQIPQFQRDFVWTREKSASLLDSIVKGYPIGAFIFWKTRERMRSVRNLGNFDLPVPADGETISLVLDGQQRLTSLFAALKGLQVKRGGQTTSDYNEIYMDLAASGDDPIVSDDFELDDEGRFIRVTDLLTSDFATLASYPVQYHTTLNEFKNRFQTYQFPIIALQDAPIEIATEVFTRVNVGGKPLTLFEIMVARTYDETKDFDLSSKFQGLLAELEAVGFETLSDASVLQLVSLLHNGEAKRQSILKIPKADFIETYAEAEKGIKSAVEYFRNTLRIPVSRLLPYATLLVPFALFFCRNNFKKPTRDQRLQLEKFFWMVSLSERYSSAVEAKLGQDGARIKTILAGKAAKYDWSVDITPSNIMHEGWFNAGRSYIKAILCLYAFHRPLSFSDNAPVRLGNDWLLRSDSRNFHHFFPKAHLRDADFDEEANHVLNIVFVDDYLNKRVIRARAPSDYLAEFSLDNVDLGVALKSHLIGAKPKFGLEDDNYPKFLQARADLVSRELGKRLAVG